MNQAAKNISEAIVGTEMQVFSVNSKYYTVVPPTIYKLSGAISALCDAGLQEGGTIREVLFSLKDTPKACTKALSWFINGDENLCEELSSGTFDEVVEGLEKSVSLISAQVFFKAVNLAKNVAGLAAKPKL